MHLTPAHRELLRRRLHEQGLADPAALRIVARAHDADAPLSIQQQGIWLSEQLSQGQATYHVSMPVRLKGMLRPESLERALSEIVRRHEVLRTVFVAGPDGQPRQRVVPPYPIVLTPIDVAPPDSAGGDLEHRIRDEASRPFDLSRGPLLRAAMFRVTADEHIILLTLHHIVCDGWSIGVLLREVAALYGAFVAGRRSPLPELAIQYGDYASWQETWLKRESLDEQLRYWREQLAGAQAVLEVPADRTRPAAPTGRGGRVTAKFGASLTVRLRELGRHEGATLFMTLLAGFQALLARYTGATDICVGTSIANRTRVETEDLIGLFVNTPVLRTELSGDPTFRDLLRRVKAVALGAYSHQELPFERLVDELQPERVLGRHPLFQVHFTLQNAPRPPLELSDLTLEPLAIDLGTTKFDLTLSITESAAGLVPTMEYAADLFDAPTVARLLTQLETLLGGAVSAPDTPVSALPLVGEVERAALLRAALGTATAPAPPVHVRVARHAAECPEAPAVMCGAERLTFAHLNVRANRLAHYLRRCGVGPESRVALAIERSPEMVVALLAVLKAGGAYLPLDSAQPAARQRSMLAHAGVHVVLARSILERPLDDTVRVLALDEHAPAVEAMPPHDPPDTVSPEQLAYILHTSGSTGGPKGVMVTHGGLANYLAWSMEAYEVTEGSGAPVQSPLTFDLTVTSLLTPLAAGRAIVLLPEEPDLHTLGTVRDMSLIKITPAHLQLLASVMPPEAVAHWTRTLVVGGEALAGDTLRFFRRHAPALRLWNEYGPTETVVGCCVYDVPEGALPDRVPIGGPIANTVLRVLDPSLALTPGGVPGELYIGGVGVARGYVGEPALTADRFRPDPFSDTPGARLYKTGDIVRLRGDGLLDFLGRNDDQVKVRGYRIELTEIEQALSRHPAVGACAVVAEHESMRLVGYATLNQPCSTASLIEFLAHTLPAYMVPDILEIVDTIPLTSHGKVDRRALTRTEAPQRPSGAASARLTPTQEIVAGLWAEILEAPVAGADDHFFHLGGHSLMATRAVARLRAAFGVALPLRCLFDRPTVRDMAATIDGLLRAGTQTPVMPLEPRTEALVPLSFAQQRLWFLDQLVKNHPYYNVPVAVRARGRLRRDALEYALEEIVRRHAALRTVFVEAEAGQPRQQVLPPMAVELPVFDLTPLPEEAREAEARRLATAEAQKPFDLREGPLWRGALLRLGSDEHLILLTLHHIVCDGWSMGVLIGEIDALYRAYCDGRPSPLLPLPIQYTDYAWWQRQWLQGEVLERDLRYWRAQLRGAPLEIALPTDYPRPQAPSFKGQRLTRVWPLWLAGELRALSRREGVTSFMTLLAGFQTLLARYGGATDLCVGTPVANRTRVEVEALIGFFVNTLVLRTDLSGNPTFRELMHRVRSVALGAYAHQDLPLERLVDELQPERLLGRNPLFQVNFALQNAPRPPLELPDLTLEPLDIDNGTTKFDLTLSVTELPQGLSVTLEYAVDLFAASTAARMLDHLATLLAAAAADPDARLAALPLSSDEERAELLRHAAGASVARETTGAHELITRHAQTHPEGIALVSGDERLTFARLNADVSRLARYLRVQGVGPERRVALHFDRSPKMVVALLAVLQAGAAYVPLDPAHPAARLRTIVEHAGVDLVLADRAPHCNLVTDGARLLVLSEHVAGIGCMPDQDLDEAVEPTQLAYILFTSGSTGQPKGVMVTHGGLTNYLAWATTAYPITAGSGAPVQSPLTFDLTVTSLLAPLAAGQTVVLLPEEPDLRALGAAAGMSLVKITPAHLQMLSATMPASSVAGWTRSLVIGGETLTGGALSFFRQHAPATRVFNEYGPTETVVGCSVYELPTGDLPERVPIGRPIANTVLRVLDEAYDLTPAGLPGELYIGGAGVARGYAGQPDLTAERFRPDPFTDTPGARLYKSGDIVRLRGDGELDFLGRRDHQVKILGYRIELGEIESALREHPAVGAAACVVADDEGRNGQSLLACVVPRKTFRSIAAEEDRISRWQSIFDTTVHAGGVFTDPASNFAGWTSSYTGNAIPSDEMNEWVERTAARILELRPRRVLEIGSGTGLLLFRVAPRCERYYATDLSPEALAAARAAAIARAPSFDHVEFADMAAHDAIREAGRDLDCIVLNSVAQYFPSADYVCDLLEAAVGRLSPGGHVFIGDVRNLADLTTLHASIAVHRAGAAELLADLRRRVEASVRNEEELLLDPRFFSTIARHWPRVTGVLCRAKLGRAVNELTKFRYDVVMRAGEQEADREAGLDPPDAGETWLDPRASFDREIARLLLHNSDGVSPPVTVGEMRQRAEAAAIDPAQWIDRVLAMEQNDRVLDPCLVGGQPAQLRLSSRDRRDPPPFVAPDDGGDWRDYANRPSFTSASDGLVADVRESLAERLPRYMVPARIVMVGRLPLTPNGKVDAASVANLARTPARASESAAGLTAPETATERLMALVWADLLPAAGVSRDDDFFSRGGHSLLATQLVARIAEVFAAAITLRDVFEAPRLCDLSARVDHVRQERSGIAWPRLERVSRTGAGPLAFAQERLWMLQQMQPHSTDFNVPLALHLEGEVAAHAIAGALQRLVERHETLRTVFAEDDSGVSYRVLPNQELVLEEFTAGSLPDAIDVGAGHARRQFELRRGPLLRAALIQAGDRSHVLVITLHHLISDSWSLGVFIRELVIAYEALTRGAEPSLPPLPIQYGDFAAWQHLALTSDALERDLDYWRGCLSDLPPLMFQPRPIADPAGASVERFEFDAGLAGALDAFSRREHASVYMVLLAAFELVLHEHTGRDDLLVATNIANRSKPDMQSLIGFLANQMMVRAKVPAPLTFRGLVAQMRRWVLDAYAHEWTPFHLVQAAVQPERHGVTSVLTQVKFNYHEIGEPPIVPGVRVRPVTIPFERTRTEVLLWQIVRTGATLRIEAEADGRYLTAADLSALLRHFALVLEHAIPRPELTVAALAELMRAKRRQEQAHAHTERRRRLAASLASTIEP